MADEKDLTQMPMPDVVSILPLRGTVLFPHAVVPLGAGRASSVRLIEEAVQGGRLIGSVMQRDATVDAPGRDELYSVGTLTVIHKVLKQSDGTLRLVVQGVGRFRILEIVQEQPFLRARVESLPEEDGTLDVELEALRRSATTQFQKVVSLSPTLPDELASVVSGTEAAGTVADLIAASLSTLGLSLFG